MIILSFQSPFLEIATSEMWEQKIGVFAQPLNLPTLGESPFHSEKKERLRENATPLFRNRLKTTQTGRHGLGGSWGTFAKGQKRVKAIQLWPLPFADDMFDSIIGHTGQPRVGAPAGRASRRFRECAFSA